MSSGVLATSVRGRAWASAMGQPRPVRLVGVVPIKVSDQQARVRAVGRSGYLTLDKEVAV